MKYNIVSSLWKYTQVFVFQSLRSCFFLGRMSMSKQEVCSLVSENDKGKAPLYLNKVSKSAHQTK